MLHIESVLQELSETHRTYLANYPALIKTAATHDFMAGEGYYDVGRSAIGAIISGLLSAGISKPRRILDFACGNGRVTRHLKLMFPEAELTVCDLYPEMVEFCSKTFDAKGLLSQEDFADIIFPEQYDLVWSGSLLTHCNSRMFAECMNAIHRSLATPGVAVATVSGRRQVALQRYVWKICSDAQFRPAEREFYRTGFGFINAFDEAARVNFPLNVNLGGGHTLSSPAHVTGLISEMENATLLYYREMGWNGHQDVFAFGTPGVFPD